MAQQNWQDLDDAQINVESQYLTELQEQKNELLEKVQALKTDLQDWRTKLESQIKTYKTEISDLRQALSKEVDELRGEFSDLKAALKQQIEVMNSVQAASAAAGSVAAK
eukprot:GHUV01017506.1.p2 GENE.GHUV01017506.1~~GHUV01017506.1.p2  ORF type:complete len:109 (+),score=47.93 GHUV01017506.1:750-1076(+)